MLVGSRAVARAGVSGSTADRVAGLVAAGERLKTRPASEIIGGLADTCAQWRNDDWPARNQATEVLAERYRVPTSSIAEVLDGAFGGWTRQSLEDWVVAELGDLGALDGFVTNGSSSRRALGPELIVAVGAHGIPTTPITDIISAVLVKAPVWLKPASATDDLAARFAATLAENDPELGAAVVVDSWPDSPGGRESVLAAATTVIATGRAETVKRLRATVSPASNLIVHGPRLSAALITSEALAENSIRVIDALACDTAFAGQMGCLSPVTAFVEASRSDVASLVEPLLEACVSRWASPPRCEAAAGEQAAFCEWRSLMDVEASAGIANRWAGDLDRPWTVVARSEPEHPSPPPVPQFLTLAPIDDVDRSIGLCAERKGLIATVGVAAPSERRRDIARALSMAGVERIAALGSMQRPPLDWRRDGRPTLADLVRWAEWEGS